MSIYFIKPHYPFDKPISFLFPKQSSSHEYCKLSTNTYASKNTVGHNEGVEKGSFKILCIIHFQLVFYNKQLLKGNKVPKESHSKIILGLDLIKE